MIKVNIKIEENYQAELKDLLKQNQIEYERKSLLEIDDLKSENDVLTVVSLLIGSAAFWTSLASIIKELVRKTDVEIEYVDEKEGKKYRIKSNSKQVDSIIEKIKEIANEEKTDDNNTKQ